MRTRRLVTLAVALMFSSLALAGVEVDYDETMDFTTAQTYAWGEGTPAPELAENRIRSAVERQLEEKGLAKTDGEPDLWVVTHARVDVKRVVDVSNTGYGGYRWNNWGHTSVNVRDIPIGTLVVDLLEGEGRNLIWRAVASATVSSTSKPEKREKRINKYVGKMFKKYPPKTKKK